MIDVPSDLRGEISGLQWLDSQQLKERYAELLPDGGNCERAELLRAVIAYRLQERFYGECLGPATLKVLNSAVGRSLALAAGVILLRRNLCLQKDTTKSPLKNTDENCYRP